MLVSFFFGGSFKFIPWPIFKKCFSGSLGSLFLLDRYLGLKIISPLVGKNVLSCCFWSGLESLGSKTKSVG